LDLYAFGLLLELLYLLSSLHDLLHVVKEDVLDLVQLSLHLIQLVRFLWILPLGPDVLQGIEL